MENDTKEFFNRSAEIKREDRTSRASDVIAEEATGNCREERIDSTGQLVQYFYNGDGYAPTTKTTNKLPSGCYTLDYINDILTFLPHNLIFDEMIQFPDSKSDSIIKEINNFLKIKNKFTKFGYSHKRGFIIFGPPGSGKTMTLMLVAKNIVKNNGIVIIATDPRMLGKMLKKFRSIEPDRQLLVIWEDFDEIVCHYGEAMIVSILDGELQVDNIIFIATTNYPERLDVRITNRPSRFDRIIKIDVPNSAAREIYFKHKLGKTKWISKNGVNKGKVIDLVESSKGFSFAHLKELVVAICCFDNDIHETIDRLKNMKHTPKSGFTLPRAGFKN